MEKEQTVSSSDTSAQSSTSQLPNTLTVVADIENQAVCLNVLEPKKLRGNPSSRPISLPPIQNPNKPASCASWPKSEDHTMAWTEPSVDQKRHPLHQIPTSNIPSTKNPKKAWVASFDEIEVVKSSPSTSSSSKQASTSNVSSSKSEHGISPRGPTDDIEVLNTPLPDASNPCKRNPLPQSCCNQIVEMWFKYVMDQLDLEHFCPLKFCLLLGIGITWIVVEILLCMYAYESLAGFITIIIFAIMIVLYAIIMCAIVYTCLFCKEELNARKASRYHKRS